jgi:hypothetical protein
MKIDELIEETFARIQKFQLHIESVLAAINALGRDLVDRGNIVERLYAAQNREWQTLFMFGLAAEKETRDRIKAAAYESFLNDHIHVAEYFGGSSSGWLVSDEKEFRRMCRELFAPSEAKDLNEEVLRQAGVANLVPRRKSKIEELKKEIQ